MSTDYSLHMNSPHQILQVVEILHKLFDVQEPIEEDNHLTGEKIIRTRIPNWFVSGIEAPLSHDDMIGLSTNIELNFSGKSEDMYSILNQIVTLAKQSSSEAKFLSQYIHVIFWYRDEKVILNSHNYIWHDEDLEAFDFEFELQDIAAKFQISYRHFAKEVAPLTDIEITLTTPDRPDATALIQELDTLLRSLYHPESTHLLNISQLMQPNVRFLLATVQNQAVGCGAVRLFEHYAEIKRMYVQSAWRGHRIGQRILAKLEGIAAEAGHTALRLETGIHQHEAIKLYEGMGYQRCEPFGEYWNDPVSLCYEKRL